eukprot:3252309-Rhodomonas_salina.2
MRLQGQKTGWSRLGTHSNRKKKERKGYLFAEVDDEVASADTLRLVVFHDVVRPDMRLLSAIAHTLLASSQQPHTPS